jgi:hypothetical protein
MKLAATRAIARLAHEPPSDVVARAYGGKRGIMARTVSFRRLSIRA